MAYDAPRALLPLLLVLVLHTIGCSRDQAPTVAQGAQPTRDPGHGQVQVIWGKDSRCGNSAVNDFVARAVRCCAEGQYEDYRLLWSYDQEPINRRRFEQLRQAMHTVEVRTVRRLQLREPNRQTRPQTSPIYLFHAYITMKEEAKQRSDHRLEDRELVLLLTNDQGTWRFTPAPERYKVAILDALASTRTDPDLPTPDGG